MNDLRPTPRQPASGIAAAAVAVLAAAASLYLVVAGPGPLVAFAPAIVPAAWHETLRGWFSALFGPRPDELPPLDERSLRDLGLTRRDVIDTLPCPRRHLDYV
jgi:hypothetical protein